MVAVCVVSALLNFCPGIGSRFFTSAVRCKHYTRALNKASWRRWPVGDLPRWVKYRYILQPVVLVFLWQGPFLTENLISKMLAFIFFATERTKQGCWAIGHNTGIKWALWRLKSLETVCSGHHQRKHQTPPLLALRVWGQGVPLYFSEEPFASKDSYSVSCVKFTHKWFTDQWIRVLLQTIAQWLVPKSKKHDVVWSTVGKIVSTGVMRG